ncbi:MAG: hypothetical protein WDW36_010208 [Sanguina aurantia]
MRRQQEPVSDPAAATAAAVAAAGVAAAGSPSGAAKQAGCEPTLGAEKVIPTENNAAADRKSDDKGSCVDDQLLWYRRPVFLKVVVPVTLSVLLLVVAGSLQASQKLQDQKSDAFRWFYFVAVMPVSWVVVATFVHYLVTFIEWYFFRESLMYLKRVQERAHPFLFCVLLLPWYQICFVWAWCGGDRCSSRTYATATDIIWKVLLCIMIWNLANLIKTVAAKLLSTHFYRTAHFKKLQKALEKEYYLQSDGAAPECANNSLPPLPPHSPCACKAARLQGCKPLPAGVSLPPPAPERSPQPMPASLFCQPLCNPCLPHRVHPHTPCCRVRGPASRTPPRPPPRSRTESRVAPSEGSFAQRNLSWLKRPRRRKECEQDSTCESPYGSEYGSDGEALGGRGSYGNLASSLSMSAAQRDPLTGPLRRSGANMCTGVRENTCATAAQGGFYAVSSPDGREEIDTIIPALDALRAEGMILLGPLPADTAFVPAQRPHYDAVLAMYHDQALPVLKSEAFDRTVNLTLGLPFIRTSVDHGTALDLAGSGTADPASLIAATTMAIDLVARRARFAAAASSNQASPDPLAPQAASNITRNNP